MGGAIIRRFALFPLMLLMLLLLPTRMVAQKAASSSKYIATYESSTQTLTFKKLVGETLPSNSAWVIDKQKVTDINKNFRNSTIVHIVFDKSFSTYTPTSLYYFFSNLTKLETITGLEYLNTEKVTDMCRMFDNCSKLTSLDVTKFNTAKVTNMRRMFSNCSSLTSLDVTHFNTAKVTVMSYMFYNCSKLTSLDVTKFNTANVTDMNCMFYNCSKLTSLDVTKFNTAKVTKMKGMFYNCSKLTSLDVTHFNTANVTDMTSMFYKCSALTTIYAGANFVTNQVIDGSNMFSDCSNLKGYADSKTNHTYANCGTDGYFTPGCGYAEFDNATRTLTFRYKGVKPEGAYGLNEGTSDPGWIGQRSKIKKVVFDASFANARPTSCYKWFYDCKELTNIEGIEYLNTEKVTDMSWMFSGCAKLSSINLSNFNTEKVTDMSTMFWNCYALTSLDVSKFNTANVTEMSSMFWNCSALASLDVSKFNTAEVTSMSYMFCNCYALTLLDLSNFNTEKVKYMGRMFDFCSSLTSLDLSNFNTEKVTDMSYMFRGCSALTTIYASDKFVTDQVTYGVNMFSNCTNLKGFIEYINNTDKIDHNYANYKTGYFTKLVGKNGDEKIGAAGETLVTDNLVLDDDKDFVAYEPFAAKAASYSRKMKEGTTWATLCLPFEVSLADKNFRAFKLLSADEGTETVELEEIEGSIAAGTPVIIKMKDGATELNFTEADKTIAKDVQTAETADANYKLQGLYTQKMFSKDTDNNCYIVKGDKLMNPAKLLGETKTESVGSKPFRAYMVDNTSASAAGARMFSISVGGSTTAIEQLETTADSKAEYYDLQGRRLQNLQKGVNIVKRGGKTMKVIIK